MAKEIIVTDGKNPIYPIVIEQSFEAFGNALKKRNVQNKKICIVSDRNVAPLYLNEVKEILKTNTKYVTEFVFSAGEENKNLDVVRLLYTKLIEEEFDRSDMLVALGGGVVGDLTGFAAATFLRGIDFIQVPTTLLSQVDSSVGGKTGVDFDSFKNMVGAFCMPKLVYMNLDVLNTMPERDYLSGMGEVVKYGLIGDKAFYHYILEHTDEICHRNLSTLEEIVAISCNAKRFIVEEDPTEKGRRALLNFGHTLGHAIEKLLHFAMYHGECVSLGMVAASYLSYKKGAITLEQLNELKALLRQLRLPVSISGLQVEDVIAATKVDKKMEAGIIKFILLQKIGDAYIDRTITEDDMRQALEYIGLKKGSEN